MYFYTYLIGWSELGKWYYGRRKSDLLPEDDLWGKYFTSSKLVKQYRETYGDPDVIKVHKTLGSMKEISVLEERFLKWVDAAKNPLWLNQHNNGKDFYNKPGRKFTLEHRKKLSENNVGFSGRNHSELSKLKIGKASCGKRHSEHAINKIRNAKLGGKNPNKDGKARLGAVLTEETKSKISQSLKGYDYGYWWHNGVTSVRAKEQPEGFVRGRKPCP